ncbi:MAG: hypothetical protein A2Y56_11080 [Candidatus Aminicenantes bacterium RBG_13_63_10]|nr:MAG: hypothetical protein A2Y56_11080 [Candidatus Aminicenantes bacterium RBG_13_63_10]
MRIFLLFIAGLMLVSAALVQGQAPAVDDGLRAEVKAALLEKHGETHRFRVEKGVDQAASLWRAEDGSAGEFRVFCLENFIADPAALEALLKRLELHFEVLLGHFNKMALDLKRPLDLDWGDILPLDALFGQYSPSAHLSDDLFDNKIAFHVLLNFPNYSLEEKTKLGPSWSRRGWALARAGDLFTSRVPAGVYQDISRAWTAAEAYIADYNIFAGRLVDDRMKTHFPENLRLITHWNLRDELKARYNDPQGLAKQKMLYQVMLRIVRQDIPQAVVNSPAVQWNPFTNKVYREGKEIEAPAEPDTRYEVWASVFRALKKLDPYFPATPTQIRRKFELEREIPESEVEKLFVDLLTSPQVKKVAKLISRRLGRPLQPFDIWYGGFKAGATVPEEELDKLVAGKYPTREAFAADLDEILLKLGFSREQADFLVPRIQVDSSRGAGHAAGAEMTSDKARLRTRFGARGMDYKGYNIAVHEFGHTVEQTLTLNRVDSYLMRGVPNNAFTEAFAYVFQDRDLELLGLKVEDPNAAHLKALMAFWNSYEIMGVALVDMYAWNWLYSHPGATPAEYREAVNAIARDVWNKYYAGVLGIKDQPILAIYSQMLMSALYMPDYPLGHVIEFQVSRYLEGKNLGREMERMCSQGRLVPQLWMEGAVGSKISVLPMLEAVDEALKHVR